MKVLVSFTAILLVSIATGQAPRRPASATEAIYQSQAASAQQKFAYIEQNDRRQHPDPRPTTFSENELNSYVNSGAVRLPKGVTQVRFSGNDTVVTTRANVDFEKVTEGRRSASPFMSLFTGVHDVEIVAHAVGVGGQGRVHIDTVSIDGIGVPRAALEFFVNRYVKPKNPDLGLDSTFRLPARVDSAVVGRGTLTVRQR